MDFFYIYNMELKIVNKKDKPNVCLCDVDVCLIPKKWLHLVKHDKESVSKEAIKKYVTNKHLKNVYMTLINGEFPTAVTKERVLKSIWRSLNINDKFEDLYLELSNIQIKRTLPINYNFDYEKH